MLLQAIRAELAGKVRTPGTVGELTPYVEPEPADYDAAWAEAYPEWQEAA
jgi:hypothetical protein